MRWAMRKFKRLKGHRERAEFLADESTRQPELFAHWQLARTGDWMVGAV